MHILVTTPKSEMENSAIEGHTIEKGGYWFRTFKFRPKIDIGDRIYFTEGGVITGFGVVFEIRQVSMGQKCDVTGRLWGDKGNYMVKYKDWKWLVDKIPFKGFQGIRYIDRLNLDKKKLRL